MNALRKALADYFAVRRALGFKLYRAEKLLGQFLTFVEDRGEDHLTTETALAWATLPRGGQTWAFARLSVVRRFANHVRGIDPATEVPPTHLLVQQKGRATPYLYSASDIAALIAAAGMLRTPQYIRFSVRYRIWAVSSAVMIKAELSSSYLRQRKLWRKTPQLSVFASSQAI